jgi:hypothetical protein
MQGMGETINVCRILMGETVGKLTFARPRRCEDNRYDVVMAGVWN